VVSKQVEYRAPERKIIEHQQKAVKMELPELLINKEYPHVLDLRKTWTRRRSK